MHLILILLIIVLCIHAPGWWAKYILHQYNREEYFSGTGKELARILLDESDLKTIGVEETTAGDHYDPIEKVVRLNPETCNKKTLTSVVIAAHEVGHAVQDASAYTPLTFRTRFIGLATIAEKIGAGLILAIPLVTLVTKVPAAGVLMFAGGFASLGLPVIIHFVTLPVEFDASFNRAMAFFNTGKYIPPEDIPAAKRILLACALTYVASALAGLLNIWRWIRVLRR